MSEFYKRQIQLWGEKTQESLHQKSIAIIGCGGLGCSLGYALSSSGIGQVYLIDFDVISLHNIHRQIAFSIKDEGRYKSAVLADILQQRVDKNVDIKPFTCNFEEFAKKSLHVDLLLDATDNLHVRSKIDDFATKAKIPWIYASVEEFNGQVCFFDKASFNDIFKIQDVKPKGQIAPMVMQVASFEANLALRYLAGLHVKKDKLYYINLSKEGEFKIQSFDMPK